MMLHFQAQRKRIEIGWQSGHWCAGILWLEQDLVDSWRLWIGERNKPSLDGYRMYGSESTITFGQRVNGFISFVLGLSRELVGYGDYVDEHRLLIHRVMLLPLVVRVMWFGRGESFWRY